MPEALSGGMARRLALVRALALDAELYLLDEPFTGIDPKRSAALMDALKAMEKPVLLSTHEPHLLAQCDYVVHMQGPPLAISHTV